MRRCSPAGTQQLAELASDAADFQHLLRRDLGVANARDLGLNVGQQGFVLVDQPRRIGSPSTDDIGVLDEGHEHRMLRRKLARLAVDLLLLFRRFRALERAEMRLDDRNALAQFFEFGRRQIASRSGRRLPGRKTDELLLEEIEFRGPRAPLGRHDRAAGIDENRILIAGLCRLAVLDHVESLLLGGLLIARGSRARGHVAQSRIELAELRLEGRGLPVRGVESLLRFGDRQFGDAFRELVLAGLILQRFELLLGFGNPFRRALARVLETRSCRRARGRCFDMAEGRAQQRQGFLADGRRDVRARLELLDPRFGALDGTVPGSRLLRISGLDRRRCLACFRSTGRGSGCSIFAGWSRRRSRLRRRGCLGEHRDRN
jgi:hypothetical protein